MNELNLDISDIEKRQKIAQETLEVFAPLSERVGLIGLKNEMEDLAFAVVQPQMRTSIMNRLSFIQNESKDILPLIIEEIRETLLKAEIKILANGNCSKNINNEVETS